MQYMIQREYNRITTSECMHYCERESRRDVEREIDISREQSVCV